MIRLQNKTVPANILVNLNGFQMAVNAEPTYPQQVEKADILFKLRNVASNPTFRVVREKLDEMCSGPRRCCYCEDSYADEVEHIRPKNLYPDLTFVWENYLYACGPCNGPKKNNFKVFHHHTGKIVDVTRRKNDPIVPPVKGTPLLIDPRTENPLDYIILDLINTFYFVPISSLDTTAGKRAQYTIEVLHLNDRDALVLARHNAFRTYRARLYEYKHKKECGSNLAELGALIANLKVLDHPTVWAEMKRQQNHLPELKGLFTAIPEALTW